MTAERFRIFISSPGDVAEERVLANNLIRRLAGEYAEQLWIEPVFWEHEPLLATSTFQTQIPPPSECEVAVCILWSRLGTRLPADITRPDGSTYASGTEYEFENAAQGFRLNGRPALLVYQKTATPLVDLTDKPALLRRLEQKEALDAFTQKWFFHEADGTLKAASHSFATTAGFDLLLEEHLRKLIGRCLPDGTAGRGRPNASWTAGSPFRGLNVFEFEHGPVYFGRTQAIADVLHALRTNDAAGKAFLLVVGISGGGKSSLVRAGVLPLLVQPGVVEGVGLWRRAVFKPSDSGGDPLRSLALALLAPAALPELASDGTTVDQLVELLRSGAAAMFALFKGGLSQAAAALAQEQRLGQQPRARLVVVVDQLEELFTLPNVTQAERLAFVAALDALVRSANAWVIATLRGDFYHRIFEIPDLVDLAEGSGHYALPLPTAAEVGQMICHPARAAGLSFEIDAQAKIPLDEVLREAASASPESLPLLEFALEELYQRKTASGLLTYSAYRELGGVEGALTHRAESVLAAQSPEAQAELPHLFRVLAQIAPSETAAGDVAVRHTAPLQDLCAVEARSRLVQAFVDGRLLATDQLGDGTPIVRLAHEALLRHWPRLQQWLADNREMLRVRSRVEIAAKRWLAEQRPADLLLSSGKPLDEALGLSAMMGPDFPDELREFIVASQSREKRRRMGRSAAVAALACLSLVCGLLALVATRARDEAVLQKGAAFRQKKEADSQRESAQRESHNAQESAKQARDRQLEVERQLRRLKWSEYFARLAQVREDIDSGNVHGARYHLDQCDRWDMCSWDYDYLAAQLYTQRGVRRLPFHLHSDIRKGALSPDGALLALAGLREEWNKEMTTEKVAQLTLIDLPTLKTARVIRGSSPFTCVTFSSDGKRVIAGSEAGTLEVYEGSTGARVLAWDPAAHFSKRVLAVAASTDGKFVATAVGGVVRLWSAATATSVRSLCWRFLGDCTGLSFSADGSALAATFTDCLQVWDTRTGKSRALVPAPEGSFTAVAFHRNGRQVAVGSSAGVIYLWDLLTSALIGLRATGMAQVSAIGFSADGTRLASGHGDGAVRLWSGNLAGTPTLLLGHEGQVRDVLFTSDARNLVSFEAERLLSFPDLRVWSVETLAARGSPLLSAVLEVAQFLPNGRFITLERSGKGTIWDAVARKRLSTVDFTLPRGSSVSMSRDGLTVVAMLASSVQVYFLRGGRPLLTLECPGKPRSVVFNKSAQILLVVHADGSAWAWDISGAKAAKLAMFSDVNLARAVGDRSIILAPEKKPGFAEYDLVTGQKLVDVPTNGPLLDLGNVSRDGRLFAAKEQSMQVTVWRRDERPSVTWNRVATAETSGLPVSSDFTPDGSRLFVSGIDLLNQGGIVESWCLSSDLPFETFHKYPYAAHSVEFSPDGRQMAVVVGGIAENARTAVEVYDDGDLFRERHTSTSLEPDEIVFDYSGNRLLGVGDVASILRASGRSASAFEVIDTITGGRTPEPDPGTICPKDSRFNSLAATVDGGLLATADRKHKQLVFWDARKNRATRALTNLPDGPTHIQFSRDGLHVAATLEDKSVRVWNVESCKLEQTLILGGKSDLGDLAWSGSGSAIAVASGDEVVQFDVVRGTRLNTTLKHPKRVSTLAFAAHGAVLYTGCEDSVIRSWDHQTGRPVATLTGHSFEIADLAVRQQGAYLASVDSHGSVIVWNTDRSERAFTVAEPDHGRHVGSLVRVAWAPDGRRIAAAGTSGYTVWTVFTHLRSP